MLNAITSFFSRPNIPVRLPNDDISFNPKEFPALSFFVTGGSTGKVTVLQDVDGSLESLTVTTRVMVSDETLKNQISLIPTYDGRQFTLTLNTPNRFFGTNITHEITVSIPSFVESMDSLFVNAPNTSLETSDIYKIHWNSLSSRLTNGSITSERSRSELIDWKSTNGSVTGSFSASTFHTETTNGTIATGLLVTRGSDASIPSQVHIHTTNARIGVQLDTTNTGQALSLNVRTTNGSIDTAVLLGEANQPSDLTVSSTNGKIDVKLDATANTQLMKVSGSTTNGSANAQLKLSDYQKCEADFTSTNGSANMDVSDNYKGRFSVRTTFGSVVVEGPELNLEENKKNCKIGYKGDAGEKSESQLTVRTTNGAARLYFHQA